MPSYTDFVAFDFETTGFTPPCKIIEIGAVKVKNGKIAESFQTFVDPKESIPYRITQITGIDNSMVKNAPSINVALPTFLEFLEDLPIAAHNARFDMTFLNYYSKALGLNVTNEVICSLAYSRKKFPMLPKHDLQSIARYIDAVQDKTHRAMYDAFVVAKIMGA